MKTTYIALKESVTLGKDNIMLSDIADVYGDCPDISFGEAAGTRVISAIEVLKGLKDGETHAVFLGPDKTIVRRPVKKKGKAIKMALIAVSLVVGGMAGILNFHADVSMREAHASVYYLVTGKTEENTPVVSIPYSIGIGLGVISFFGLFNKKAGLAEIELYEYNKQMDAYDRDSADA